MRNSLLLSLAILMGAASPYPNADEGHDHNTRTERRQTENESMHGEHGHSDASSPHQHEEWIDPPVAYADKVSDKWVDADAIARGEEIYNEQCVSCHGADGQGTGPLAQSLSHPPADLTNNFHVAPGNGDAYLFWRVSEGGTVEPFKSQDSAMPAFKNILSASERWDVLAYTHAFFHQGLLEWQNSGRASSDDSDDGHDS